MILSYLKKLLISGLVCISAFSFAQNKLKDTYPAPKADNLLFYLQRSKNKNTIVYELNTLPDGSLNPREPVHASWLRYEEGGKKLELSYIQRTLAFGINAKLTDKQNGNYLLTMVSYKARTLFLQKSLVKNKYRILLEINGKMCVLQSIFVNAKDNYWGYPIVESVELFGIDEKTGAPVYEKIPVKQG